MAFMAVTGEYLCMRTELRAIPVNSGPKSNLWIFIENTEKVMVNSWGTGSEDIACNGIEA